MLVGVPKCLLFEILVKAFFFNVLWAAVQIALDESQGVTGFIAQVGILCPVHSNLVCYLCVYQGIWRRGKHPDWCRGCCTWIGPAESRSRESVSRILAALLGLIFLKDQKILGSNPYQAMA